MPTNSDYYNVIFLKSRTQSVVFDQVGTKFFIMSKRNIQSRHEQNREFFTNLPCEITMEILSRLPVRSVKSCKCVCKSWLNLLETEEFLKSHLSKAVPGLVVSDPDSCIIYDFNDAPDLEEHELHYDPVIDFKFNHFGAIHGSVNGALLVSYLSVDSRHSDLLCVLNPVTFEYIQLSRSEEFVFKENRVVTYGFGESRETRQLKAVRIFHDCIRLPEEFLTIYKLECRVYTLGTRSWRSIEPGPMLEYDGDSIGALLYGNLHWLVYNAASIPTIACFDLEDESFSYFHAPPELPCNGLLLLDLHALEDCLCVSNNMSDEEFVVWFMKDYKVKNTWTKDLVISKLEVPYFVRLDYQTPHPVKMFKDGEILMIWGGTCFFYYSAKDDTTRELEVFEMYSDIETILHTSSFFSLRGFGNEEVGSFLYI